MDGNGTFLERYGPRALILGGSEGIGAAFADRLAAQGFELTLVSRSTPKLDVVASDLRARYGTDVVTHALDLTSPEAIGRAGEIVGGSEFGLVIYNAGAAHGVGLFLDQPLQRALDLVALNCTTTTAFAHHALAPMRARGKGGLILVSSMSGLVGAGYVAAYGASKAFEITLCEGLHWEMARDGVDVMCAVASLTDTPAMARSGMIMDADANYTPMTSDDVARGALASLGKQAVWFAAGDAAATAIRSAPRETMIDAMSRTSARLWGIELDQGGSPSGA